MLKSMLTIAKVAVLAIILTICYIIGVAAVGLNRPLPSTTSPAVSGETNAQPAQPASAPDPGRVLAIMLIYSAAVSVVVSFVVLRSQGRGWKLAGAVMLGMFGISTVLSQMESIIYLPDRMPPGMIPRLFLLGAIVAALFAPIAVLILGRFRRGEQTSPGPSIAVRQWVVPLFVIGVIYLVLYMVFGYYVAWKNPAVRAYYGGTDPGSFFAQMHSIWSARPWMFAFQIGRGIAWALFLLPMVRLMRRSRSETALAMALFSGVWTLILLLPNQLMPPAVAHTHLYETLSSGLIFGALVGWWLSRVSAAKPVVLAAGAGN